MNVTNFKVKFNHFVISKAFHSSSGISLVGKRKGDYLCFPVFWDKFVGFVSCTHSFKLDDETEVGRMLMKVFPMHVLIYAFCRPFHLKNFKTLGRFAYTQPHKILHYTWYKLRDIFMYDSLVRIFHNNFCLHIRCNIRYIEIFTARCQCTVLCTDAISTLSDI